MFDRTVFLFLQTHIVVHQSVTMMSVLKDMNMVVEDLAAGDLIFMISEADVAGTETTTQLLWCDVH